MKKAFLVVVLLMATAAQAQTSPGMDTTGSTPPPLLVAAASGQSPAASSALPPEVEGLKEQMLGDAGIMKLIMALQSDPQMQALLNDPAVMNAIQSGDLGALLQNPAFLKLLDNPRVKEIEKMMQGDTK